MNSHLVTEACGLYVFCRGKNGQIAFVFLVRKHSEKWARQDECINKRKNGQSQSAIREEIMLSYISRKTYSEVSRYEEITNLRFLNNIQIIFKNFPGKSFVTDYGTETVMLHFQLIT